MATLLNEPRMGKAPEAVPLDPGRALTPQARRLLEGPVLPTLLWLAAPTVALMLLQGVIAAGEAAFVGRLGSHALAGVSLSFPLVMLMTTFSAGAFGGGVASGVARALARAGRTPRSSPGRPWGCPHFWASPRPPSCWPSGGRSTPRWARPARRWMRPPSTPTCSSSGPSRSGYSTPPRVSCAAGATPPTLPPRGPSREPSRSRSPRWSSSRRASGSPAPRGPWSATTS